ncbi:MAG: DUF6290 family protein [Xanthobacteraceae bacterium]|jgi:uncharacterized protein (DUF1778 family)
MTTSVLTIRLSQEERAILKAASELARTNLSEFIRRKALAAAEADLLERRTVTIPANDWEAFEAWAHRSADETNGLKELAAKAPTWQE